MTKVEAKRRGPAIAARLSGRAELFKERLDRVRLQDRETGVHLFPISDNLSPLMALVMADLSESQKETFMNLIFQ